MVARYSCNFITLFTICTSISSYYNEWFSFSSCFLYSF